LSVWFDRFIETRVDVGTSAKSLYGNAQNKLGRLADRDPTKVRPSDVQGWIADNASLSPKTIRHYLSSIRQVLDFADVEPNPARSPKVKVPALQGEEITPPSREEFDAIISKLAKKVLLPAKLMEACGLRVGEITQLLYGDVDFADGRFRISRSRTKGGTAGQRWLPVPDELMDEIDALVPLEDRHHERRVFPLTAPEIRDSITRACKLAKIPRYHPHDLRHRRISLWVRHGFDPVTVKTWAGHSNASMSLDTYAHVVIDAGKDPWKGFWTDAYSRAHVVPVWSQDLEPD
jgi:integrase